MERFLPGILRMLPGLPAAFLCMALCHTTVQAQQDPNARAFLSFDADKDTELDTEEFRALMERLGNAMPPAQAVEFMKLADLDRNAKISYPEYRVLEQLENLSDARDKDLLKAFYTVDISGDSSIELFELDKAFHDFDPGISSKAVLQSFKEADSNGDSRIDFREFLQLSEQLELK